MATLVLGIGNLLWADEGFGVRCVERFAAEFAPHPGVEVVDGGTQGLYLLPQVQAADRLLIFDAIDFGLPPATLRVLEGDEVPRFMGARKMSLHQTGFQEVLACARLTGQMPAEVVLVGVQPEQLEDYGGSLRDSVKGRIPEALALARAVLARWGIELEPRALPRDAGAPAGAPTAPPRVEGPGTVALGLDAYERGRPDESSACRRGDGRVLAALGH
ncbi:MAG: HyaD/HybD family hydrogenase maturation endopeptidase [Steroidobacteraceae bacterium]|jgi:hydrogenase maturation protease|nr:HyaD/HybD family hydrogenase maturation endopeptidase [Steroidobacteraceae bacterium]